MLNNKSTIPIIREEYVDSLGNVYKNVREIAYEKNNICGNLGKYITESNGQSNKSFCDDVDLNGVLIYQNRIDKKIGYRIYKDTKAVHKDNIMIEELVKRQPKIKHSLFPTGVVTLDGRVIGQEIPFFDNAITLSEFCNKVINKTTSPKEAIKIHLEILKIMRELYENGIYYLDGHNNNFMVLKGDNHNITDGTNINMIAMIDYSPENIVFDELDEYKKKRLFECLRNYCLSILNYRFGINKIVGPFPYFYSFDELEEIILEQDHILTKTIHK